MADSSSLAAEAAHSSLKRARLLFQHPTSNVRSQFGVASAVDPTLSEAAVQRRRRQRTGVSGTNKTAGSKHTGSNQQSQSLVVASPKTDAALGETVTEARNNLVPFDGGKASATENYDDNARLPPSSSGGILVRRQDTASSTTIPTPQWHAPWKLSTVLSSHLGWVRCIAMDPENRLFATGAADRVIKIWNFPKASVGASDALQLTLTGHISPVRGLAFSPKHPYLFSCAEDKTVKCWDLETNQVIRHYHGHLSGVFCLALHPTLDVLVTGGRDAVARVWDMRTKTQIHTLAGHEHTVASVLTQSTNPQIITGSHDCTVKLWDLVAGKCMTTLTHHQKSVRALAAPSFEKTFVSGAADGLKRWQSKDGRFLQTMTGHKAVVNALAVNDDGVLVSGGDDGSLHFWDYKTGYGFQQTRSVVQPGSLEAENGVMACCFDATGSRLITGETDKTVKIWKPDETASELTHPIDTAAWRKKCIAQAKQRY
jgi:pleiotropic regulator 1